MEIFNSYVKLPEGTSRNPFRNPPNSHDFPMLPMTDSIQAAGASSCSHGATLGSAGLETHVFFVLIVFLNIIYISYIYNIYNKYKYNYMYTYIYIFIYIFIYIYNHIYAHRYKSLCIII